MLVDDAGGACLRRGQARWLDDKSAWAFCKNCAWNELDALPRDVAVADDSAMAARAELEDWAVDFAFALLSFFARAARGASAEERARERNGKDTATSVFDVADAPALAHARRIFGGALPKPVHTENCILCCNRF